MDREWYEEAGYGPTDEQSVGAARGRTQLRDGQSRNDYEIPTNNPTRRLSHSASHPILSSHATASSSGAPRIAGPSSSTIASVRATHPYALVFPTAAASSPSTPYHPRPQPSHQIQNPNAYAYERQDPHSHSAQTQWQQPRHAHIGSQTSVHATSAGPGARAGGQGYDRDAVYPFDAPSASASASAPAHGPSRTFRMQQPYEPGYAYDYDSSPQSAFQLQSQQQQQQQNPFSPTIERVSTLSPHPYSQAHPAHKVSEASMAAAARATKSSSVRGTKGSNSLRYSLSTPNLRNFFRMGSSDKDKEKEKEKEKKQVVKIKTQYTAETWCDALVFPRPRFRAHIISPPASPLPGDSAIIERAVDLSRITNLSPQAQAQAGPSNINAFASSSSVRLPTYHQSPSADHLGTYASHFSLDTPQNSVRVPKVNLQSPPPGKLKAHKKQNASKSTTSTGAPQLPPLPTDNVNLSMTEEALRAGAQRDREREEWNVLAKKSFQNRRSRSLSRPRKKSLGAGAGANAGANASKISLRARVDSEASAESTRGRTAGLSVTKALTNLAAEVFRQPAPTISSVSNQGHGFGTESGLSHSRNTSDSYGRGGAHGHTHARNTSWGKAALKKLCGPEEDVVQAEIEEAMRKRMQLEEALKNEGTMRIGIGNRARTEEDHERQRAREREVQFVDISARPQASDRSSPQSQMQQRQGTMQVADPLSIAFGRTTPQSQVSDSMLDIPAVGIALSTPPPPLTPPTPPLPDLSSHPYAQQPSGHRERESTYPESPPLPAAYAGPHPVSRDYKPRFPIHRSRSPEAAQNVQNFKSLQEASRPNPPALPSSSELAPTIKSESTAESEASKRRQAASLLGPSAYAYANISRSNQRESTLGVEESLTRTFQSGRSALPPLPGSPDLQIGLDGEYIDNVEPTETEFSPVREAALPESELTTPVTRSSPNDASKSSPPPMPDTSPDTLPESADMVLDASQEVIQPHRPRASTAMSSPSSFESSFPGSPRPLGKLEDVEFQDLFFKPGQTPSQSDALSFQERPAPPSRDTSNSWLEDRILSRSSDGLSGFGYLARQLSERLERGHEGSFSESVAGNQESRDYGGDRDLVVVREDDGPEVDQGHRYNHNPASEHESMLVGSPQAPSLSALNDDALQIGTPMRAEFTQGQDFPEDVDLPEESSRASSTIEDPIAEDTVRIGTVIPSVPITTQAVHRQSTALSLDDVEVEEFSPDEYYLTEHVATLHARPGGSSNYPGGDFRTSYLTATSSTSHMDHIIDHFPTVPAFPQDAIPPSRPDSMHVLGLASQIPTNSPESG
ncbi:hypothetical protein M422DRAFT_68990 [Sphaerobolus stellatus SS14]|uniref:Uncharacterized protein n=1 Tax=Sphaerobolus stellatus (strain SS14) TaxID=990650 RepID=A0A0C9VAV3_SPHS4|nr:hypothetical protein M422DRAFT_68990 [Sphaerobolus stellatus SS14]